MYKRAFLANALERTFTGNLLSATFARWNGVVIFNYHRVGDPAQSDLDRALFSASQEDFERQVRFLKTNFDVIRTEDLAQTLLDPSAQAVMITFDDGYRDNYDIAFPVLKQWDATALFFITSGYLDLHPISWWDEVAWMVRTCKLSQIDDSEVTTGPMLLKSEQEIVAATRNILLQIKSLPENEVEGFLDRLGTVTGTGRCPCEVTSDLWMTWDMVREMDRAGLEIGGHTVTHPVLANCDVERQRFEIETSKQRIEKMLGHTISAFSYPVGQRDSFTSETKQLLERAGYEWGFSFYGGYSPVKQFDPYDLPRIPVEKRLTENHFRSIARLPQIFARK